MKKGYLNHENKISKSCYKPTFGLTYLKEFNFSEYTSRSVKTFGISSGSFEKRVYAYCGCIFLFIGKVYKIVLLLQNFKIFPANQSNEKKK